MTSLENPKALAQTISIAPTDGQRPLAIMTDKILNPCLILTNFVLKLEHLALKGEEIDIHNQQPLDVHGRFAKVLDLHWFVAEAKPMLDNFIWRQKKKHY